MRLQIKGGRILGEVLTFIKEAENKKYRGLLLEGGSRSGKTYNTLLALIIHTIQNANKGKRYLFVRKALTYARATLLADLVRIVKEQKLESFFKPQLNPRRPEQSYNFFGNEWVFIGTDDTMRLHGLTTDYIFFNEAVELKKDDFDNLEMRCRGWWIADYNPIQAKHWLYEYAKRDDVKFIHSTFRDNPFISENELNKILSYEPTPENIRQGTADEYKWRVYGLGERASLLDLIYPYWEYYETEPKEFFYRIWGLDFGFANSPTAIAQVTKVDDGNALFVREILYQTGMTIKELAQFIYENLDDSVSIIVCDSSEPEAIEQLRRWGLPVVGAKKGKGSVLAGIELVKAHKLFINKNSKNLIDEIENYRWLKNKEGIVLNVPVKENDHLMDAMRYAVQYGETNFRKLSFSKG